MKPKQSLYQSYLLRLYGTFHGGKFVWRASLENPAGGEKIRFDSMEVLFRYLQEQCSAQEASQEGTPG